MPYANVKDRIKNSKDYYNKNKNRIKSYIKIWATKNPEKVKEYSRKKARSRTERGINKAYYSKNRDRIKDNRKKYENKSYDKIKNRRLISKYGITLDFFNKKLKEQNNKCDICLDDFGGGKYPQVDHCHETGRVRGLLCKRCNMLEGFLLAKKELIEKIQLYKIKYK